MSSSKQTVICEEIFDDTSQASITEIREYASKIGIDPDSEPQLLPLAVEALMKPLPTTWNPCYDDEKKAYYYLNQKTRKTQWEHPLDNIYRDLVSKARTESQSLSFGEQTEDATCTRDDLPSYEEPFSMQRHDLKLSPLKTRPKLGDITKITEGSSSGAGLSKQKSEDCPAISGKSNLSLFSSFDESNLKFNKGADKDVALKVSGGGSMFLKSNTKKQSDSTQSLPLSQTDTKPCLRSILRENADSEKTDREEDDKKSVRFNMETTPNLYFNISDESDDDSDKNESIEDALPKVIPATTYQRPTTSRFTVVPVKDSTKDIESDTDLKQVDAQEKECDDEYNTEKFFKMLTKSDSIEAECTNTQKPEDVEDVKKELLNESQKVLQNYRVEISNSQETQMQNILATEKSKHKMYINSQLENLKKEMENRLNFKIDEEKIELEIQLEKKKEDLCKHYQDEEKHFEQSLLSQYETKKLECEKLNGEKLTKIERELSEKLEKHKDDLIVSHNAILNQIKQNHSAIIDELQKDYKSEEDIIRREHHKQISDLRNKVTKEIDAEKMCTKDVDDERLYEKVRCEKRLLEDKYRCLKDKYLKLKTEVKLSIEKRNRKKEQNLTTTNTTTTTTGSETEKSPPEKKERIQHHSPSTNRRNSPKHSKSAHNDQTKYKSKIEHKFRHIVHDQDTSVSDQSYVIEDKINHDSQREYDSSDLDINPGRSRKKLFSRLKSSAATSRINNTTKSKESQRSCSPVENLRKQLQKLEDLEDQFPPNAQGDTYHLRYPFSDGQKFEGSSELEFFRHRIHLERDSIRRAKDSLRKQKSHFKQRQNELKHGPSARNTLKQLYQEEKELTDMEVSLHRTRSLLGEKVIRLRHLEQSLHRATAPNDQSQNHEDATLSDLSSHSASSGISSSDFIMADTPIVKGAQFKESSEIIQSLENLNSEIREIWDVLHKQQQTSNVATVFPPLPLLYPDLGWPLLAASAPVPPSIPTLADRLQNYRQHVALANAQGTMVTHDTQGATTTLVEKTRNLRQWLRQTTVDATVDANIPEATL